MPNANDIVVKQLRCSIRIESSSEFSNDGIRKRLREIISGILPENTQETLFQSRNPIEEFFRYYYYSTQGRELSNSVYFLDYQEREGSFIITFSFLVITTFSSYASIRQGIDTFINDMSNLCRGVLNTPRVVGIIEKEVDVLSESNSTHLNTMKYTFRRNIQIFIPYLSFFISIFVAIFLLYYSTLDTKSKNDMDEILLDYKIQKNLNGALNEQKLDYLFYTHYNNDTTDLGKLRRRILDKSK